MSSKWPQDNVIEKQRRLPRLLWDISTFGFRFEKEIVICLAHLFWEKMLGGVCLLDLGILFFNYIFIYLLFFLSQEASFFTAASQLVTAEAWLLGLQMISVMRERRVAAFRLVCHKHNLLLIFILWRISVWWDRLWHAKPLDVNRLNTDRVGRYKTASVPEGLGMQSQFIRGSFFK